MDLHQVLQVPNLWRDCNEYNGHQPKLPLGLHDVSQVGLQRVHEDAVEVELVQVIQKRRTLRPYGKVDDKEGAEITIPTARNYGAGRYGAGRYGEQYKQ